MVARLILSALLACIVLYAWRERRRSRLVSALALAAALAGVYLVWVPSHASTLANWAGVGRGVDLVIYLWVVISLLLLLNLHLKLRAQLELITILARQIAIATASPGGAGLASAGQEQKSAQDHADADHQPKGQRLGEQHAA
jgi:hypothetical protein